MSFLNANQSEKSTILITGGATGIGLAVAQRLLALGHVVIAAGRRADVLEKAAKANPGLKTIQGDVSTDAGRIALFEKTVRDYPAVNVLFNNAGVVHMELPPLKASSAADWAVNKSTLAINLEGPIHLSILFLPQLLKQPRGLVMFNTSMLAIFPFANESVYSASKAALHSFGLSLRQQLKGTAVQVVEVLPGPVETDMAPKEMNPMNVDVYADDLLAQLLQDVKEIAHPDFQAVLRGSRDLLDQTFDLWNGNTDPAVSLVPSK
jgi:uncharacterized oxidoreductase